MSLDHGTAEIVTSMLREADSVDPELTVRVGISSFSKLLAEIEHLKKQRDELQTSNTKLQQAGLVDTGDVLAGLGADERRVMVVLAGRLRRGAKAYGPLDLATDQRDWEKERGEEVADLLVYSAFDELKRLAREGKA